VPLAAATLRRRYHPGLELQLAEANHPAVARKLLRDGEVEVAVVFRTTRPWPKTGSGTGKHLDDDPMYLHSLHPGQTLADHHDST